MQIYVKNRGKELPGNYNHILLSELYHVQSSRWPVLARDHLENVFDEIVSFVAAALRHITADDQVLVEILELTTLSLQKNMQAAKDELEKLCHDEKLQPITYNHYYTDNIQNARQEATKRIIKKAMNETTTQDWNGKLHVSNTTWDAAKLLSSLQNRITVNMDGQACAEALSGLQAYYKVRLQ